MQEIFRFPPTVSLSAVDKDLLWKFRFSLFRSPRSLTKFLKCVTWSDQVESKQAAEKLLPLWGQDVGMDDALELLGPGFTDRRVRAFAVRRLERADDEVSELESRVSIAKYAAQELLLYLLQLVQALKFELPVSGSDSMRSGRSSQRRREALGQDEVDSGLSQFLIDRSVANSVLGTAFHWYLMIECGRRLPVGKMYAKVAFRFMQKLAEVSSPKRVSLRSDAGRYSGKGCAQATRGAGRDTLRSGKGHPYIQRSAI